MVVYSSAVGTNQDRKRQPGVDVDAASIRRARLAAGLSLSQVAGSELTRAAVHRVEQGIVRPSMRTLRLIAERTGTPVEALLAPTPGPSSLAAEAALDLARLERLATAGRHAEVVEAVDELLTRGAPPAAVEARLRHLAGRAHVQLLHPDTALIHLRRARAEFERTDDRWLAVDCMGWETAALSIKEDPTAITVAEEALRRCRELDPVPVDTQARIMSHMAGIHLSRHEWDRAIAAYQAAVVAAAPVVDLTEMSRMCDGLSIAYQGLGDLEQARTYAEKAVALSSVVAGRQFQARMENNLGVLLLRSEDWQEAERHLRLALEHCDVAGIEQGKSHVLLSLAQLALAQGDRDRAEARVREAVQLAERIGEAMTHALAQQWLGRVLEAAGRPQEADRAFVRAVSLLESQRAPLRLAECHRDFAEALQRRGDLQRAVLHWQRAAELWQPPVDAVAASEWVDGRSLAGS